MTLLDKWIWEILISGIYRKMDYIHMADKTGSTVCSLCIEKHHCYITIQSKKHKDTRTSLQKWSNCTH